MSDPAAILVLAVALDDLTLSRLTAALRGTELRLHAVDHVAAIARAQAEDGPVIALLEWSEEGEAHQARLCDALRRAARPGKCHIVALGALADPALGRALDGSTNDVLTRPFGGEVLLRLRQAVRVMASTQVGVTPRSALDEALGSATGGEVVVRSGDVVARMHVQGGLIVWADLSSEPTTMEELARHAGLELEADVLAAAKEECRASRVHFMDVLVAWRLVDPDRAKEAVHAFVAGRVSRVLDLPGAAAIFLPRSRPTTEQPRFGVGKLPPVRPPPSRAITPFPLSPPSGRPLPLGEISEIFQGAAQIDGVLSVAILDRKTGASLLVSGAEIDTSVAWSQLGMLAALGPHAEDVIGSAADSCFVTRPLRVAPALALFVVLQQSATTIGLARMTIARLASRAGTT